MKISSLVLAGVLSLSATVAAASTVLTPVDGNANFLVSDSFYNAGYQLAIFDDSAAVTSGVISASGLGVKLDGPTVTPFATYYGGIIGFSSFPPYIATNGYGSTLALSGNSDFIVGLSTDGGATWYADDASAAVAGAANTVTLSFPSGEAGAFVVDVQLAPVPLPAAAWLFGTGLIGLVGVARRRA